MEGYSRREQLPADDAEAPHVALMAVGLAKQHLGTHTRQQLVLRAVSVRMAVSRSDQAAPPARPTGPIRRGSLRRCADTRAPARSRPPAGRPSQCRECPCTCADGKFSAHLDRVLRSDEQVLALEVAVYNRRLARMEVLEAPRAVRHDTQHELNLERRSCARRGRRRQWFAVRTQPASPA